MNTKRRVAPATINFCYTLWQPGTLLQRIHPFFTVNGLLPGTVWLYSGVRYFD